MNSSLLRTASFTAKRMRKCKVCRAPFSPRSMTHKVCCGECGKALAEKNRLTADRKATRIRLQALKSRADHLKEAQAALNAWIRKRDELLPCISCGRHHTGQYHAGHYLSVGAHPELRFNELNIAKQCQPCNVHLSGNALNFRVGLIARIGIGAVEGLEGPHAPRKYTIADAQAIKAEYKQKLRELKAC